MAKGWSGFGEQLRARRGRRGAAVGFADFFGHANEIADDELAELSRLKEADRARYYSLAPDVRARVAAYDRRNDKESTTWWSSAGSTSR